MGSNRSNGAIYGHFVAQVNATQLNNYPFKSMVSRPIDSWPKNKAYVMFQVKALHERCRLVTWEIT